MALTSQSWNAVVKKKFLTTGNFKQLDTAVKNYLSGTGNVDNLRLRWNAWIQKFTAKGLNYTDSDRYTTGCALDDIHALLNPGAQPIRPRSLSEQIRLRDALSPERSTAYAKVDGKFKAAIFTQERTNSCTIACASTLAQRVNAPGFKESNFIEFYNKANNEVHDFEAQGSFLGPVAKALQECGVDAVHHDTPNWTALKAFLDNATHDRPVLLAVAWRTSSGAPGGAHALLCTGPGMITFASGSELGLKIEDPWRTHTGAMMQNNGVYYVQDSDTSVWALGDAGAYYGCITAKNYAREYGKPLSHTKGIKVM